MSKILFRVAAVVGLSLVGATGVAMAANPPSSGLGQAWPNAADVSASPHWHAYVFTLGGVKYIQVNDLNGNVLGAVGTANGQFITLPIGAFSQLVSTPQQPAVNTQATSEAAPTAAPTTVYQDATTQVTATPMSNGTVMLQAANTKGSGYCDPIVCATQGIR